jgi:hypothetical protein
MPCFVSRLGARDCMTGLAPSITRVASGPAAPKIQQPLALRVEVKEAEHLAARRWSQWALAADEFVVRHASVGQNYGSPCLDPFSRAERKARSEHHRVQQIAFLSQVARHGAVVERTRQRRDEVEVTGGSTLQKAATRNFDYHVDLGRLKGVPARKASTQVCIVHRASISREQPRGCNGPACPFDERKRKTRQRISGLGIEWWRRGGSNSRPSHCERDALPAELRPHEGGNYSRGGGIP